MLVREARARYFAENGFGDGGYDDRFVVLRIAGVPALVFPNTKQRVRSVRIHDVHHVLTGYATSWRGEGEIGAWELASGCRDHWAAWFLNFWAAGVGLVIAPRAIGRAFRRGRDERGTSTNGSGTMGSSIAPSASCAASSVSMRRARRARSPARSMLGLAAPACARLVAVQGCDGEDGVEVLCGFQNPEDLGHGPGRRVDRGEPVPAPRGRRALRRGLAARAAPERRRATRALPGAGRGDRTRAWPAWARPSAAGLPTRSASRRTASTWPPERAAPAPARRQPRRPRGDRAGSVSRSAPRARRRYGKAASRSPTTRRRTTWPRCPRAAS